MAIALSGDAKIYYETHGAGPAVLFVHGSGGHHAAWWQQVAALSPSYTVITVCCGLSAATCCHQAAWCPPEPCTSSTAGPEPLTS